MKKRIILFILLLHIGCHYIRAESELCMSNYLDWAEKRGSTGGYLEGGYLTVLPEKAWNERNKVVDYLKRENLRSSDATTSFFLMEMLIPVGSTLKYEYEIVQEAHTVDRLKANGLLWKPNIWPVRKTGFAYFKGKFASLASSNVTSRLSSTSPVFYLIAYFDGSDIHYYMTVNAESVFRSNLDIKQVEPQVSEVIKQAFIVNEVFSILGLEATQKHR